MQADETTTLTSETALIMERMVELSPEEPRYQVLKAVVDYKASWIELAEQLNVVAINKDFKQWGYTKFKDYCQDELQIPSPIASKLVKGFQWIDREAPELLPRFIDEEGDAAARDASATPRVLPDMETVDVLLKAEREVAKDRLSKDAYDDLKAKALKGDQPVKELKKELKDAIVEPEKEFGPKEQLKALRRTLTAAEKIVTQLEEILDGDEEVQELAGKLREKLFERVSSMLDEQAYGEGGKPEDEEGATVTVGTPDAPSSEG